MKLLKRIYKDIFFILIFILCSNNSYGQGLSSSSKKAIKYYTQARNTIQPKEAAVFLQKAIEADDTFAEAYWFLASLLHDSGKYAQQIELLETAAQKTSYRINSTLYKLATVYYENGFYQKCIKAVEQIEPSFAATKKVALLEKAIVAENFKQHPVQFDPVVVDSVCTPYDDYWPSLTMNGKVLSTTVLIADKSKSNLEWNEEIYWSSKDKNGNWTQTRNIGRPTNTEDNEGSQNFSMDGKYLFFVACDRPDSKGSCDIYYSVHDGTGWSLPINPGEPLNTRYWETNPCLSANGKELFFASNRPGGFGKKDIWRCPVMVMDDGTLRFGNPVNLGDTINTDQDEFSPFLHPDGQTLYFASNGHPGLGGLDIFYSKQKAPNQWTTPKNIGYPINTHKDEYGFIVDSKGEKAYFSSDLTEKNDRDIYEISLYEAARPTPMYYISGTIAERENKMPLKADIEMFDLETGQRYSYTSNPMTGSFFTYIPVNKDYGINVYKRGFLFYSDKISAKKDGETKIQVLLDKLSTGKSLVLNNISFLTDSHKLRSESEPELQQILALLQQNPTVEIKLVGHTDNTGSHEHNMRLSQNRAQSVFYYLAGKGIDKKRMSCEGKGETEPIADNDTEEGKALNRRTELIITKI